MNTSGTPVSTPGFWQGALKSFLNNDTSTQFKSTTTENLSTFLEREHEDDDATEELNAITDFAAEEQENPNCSQENNNSTKRSETRPKFKSPHGSNGAAGGKPTDFRKSVKVAYDIKASQQKRRDILLAKQQQRRDDLLEKIRSLEKSSSHNDSEIEEDEDFVQIAKRFKPNPCLGEDEIDKSTVNSTEQMETQQTSKKSKKNKSKFSSSGRKHRPSPSGLMMSEWLNEKPDDFEDGWLGVLCPVGKRCMVVTMRSKTYVFSRKNEYIGIFQSLLPGGFRANQNDPELNRNKGITMLDCIWSADAAVFYVLDILSWNSYSCNNCDKEFRQFFQTSKFAENPSLMQRIPFSNPFPFLPLPSFSCDRTVEVMSTTVPIFKEKVDGVLFFHKQSFYYPEVNPLCLWVYLTEMEEKLQVSVSPELLSLQTYHPKRSVKVATSMEIET